MTSFLVMACALLLSSADAQAPTTSAIKATIMDMITQMMSQPSSFSPSSFSPSPAYPSSPQVSLVESFGPIGSSSLQSGTQTASDPFFSPQAGATFSSTNTQSSGSSTTSQGSDTSSGSSQAVAGGDLAKLFGSGSPQPASSGSSSSSPGSGGSNYVSGGTGLVPGSEPLGNDILSKIQAFVNRPPPSYNPSGGSGSMMPASASALISAFVGAPIMGDNYGPMGPTGLSGPGLMGPGSMGMVLPLSALSRMLPGMLMNPVQSQATLRMSRRLGQKLGVNQYYEIHGCEDPVQLFSGRQKAMATLAMAQGCNSFRAMHVCRMAQVKERIGNSLLTSRVLQHHIRSRLESCLSAKVLFSHINSPAPAPPPLSMGILPALLSTASSASAPSLRECGALLSTVMDGGSLDPESMIATRRSMLPWSCNESSMGPNNIPYRVCCPGKVMEPTLQEAQIVQTMINA